MGLLRNFVTVGSATMGSRLLGFIRDAFLAAALGTGAVADAFVVAQRFPNLFRRLFAEGAFSAAFIPLFARTLTTDGEEPARRFADEALAGLVTVLLLLTILAEIAMPWLTVVLAPGFVGDDAKFDLTVLLTRIAFPYLLLISVAALLSGVLNGLGRFTAAAMAPSLMNAVLIAALVVVYWQGLIGSREAGILLSWAITIGGVAQIALLVVALWRAGFAVRLVRPRWNDAMKRLVKLGVPGAISGGITQINLVIGTIIASLEAGAVSVLYYADRLYQLPLGVVGAAVAVVLLPELSRRLSAGDPVAASHTMNRSLEFAMLLTLPAAIALAVVPATIVQVLFERGAFGPADTARTAVALAAFAAGLPFFVLIKVLQPGFFAREDTTTPMRFAVVSAVVNIVGSLALFPFMGALGIAVATSLAAVVNAVMLGLVLRRRGHLVADARLWRRLAAIAAASIAMGAVLLVTEWALRGYLARTRPEIEQALALGGLVSAGLVTFGVAALLFGAVRIGDIRAVLRRRRSE